MLHAGVKEVSKGSELTPYIYIYIIQGVSSHCSLTPFILARNMGLTEMINTILYFTILLYIIIVSSDYNFALVHFYTCTQVMLRKKIYSYTQ